jgi:hypothetical protein
VVIVVFCNDVDEYEYDEMRNACWSSVFYRFILYTENPIAVGISDIGQINDDQGLKAACCHDRELSDRH